MEATSALACFLVCFLFESPGNLEMLDGGKLENVKKNPLSKARPSKELNPLLTPWPVQNHIGASFAGASVLATIVCLILLPVHVTTDQRYF